MKKKIPITNSINIMNSKDKLEEKFIKACWKKKKKQPRQRNEMIYNQKK